MDLLRRSFFLASDMMGFSLVIFSFISDFQQCTQHCRRLIRSCSSMCSLFISDFIRTPMQLPLHVLQWQIHKFDVLY
ncbi:hypothetical protein ACLB2K_046117 [Fragaria x ananassa]